MGVLVLAVTIPLGFVIIFSHASSGPTNPSGMQWASGCWPAGGTGEVLAFENYRGTKCDYYHIYTSRGTWDGLDNPSFLSDGSYPTSLPGQLLISTETFPDPQDARTPYSECASGLYNSHFTTLGNNLINQSAGRWKSSVLRPDWEFNGQFMPWGGNTYAGDHPVPASDYVKCFDNYSRTVKAADPYVVIDWTMNGHSTPGSVFGGNAFNTYPGDNFVDVVGIDYYDQYATNTYPPMNSAVAWNASYNDPSQPAEQLGKLVTFAGSHRKLFSVGEWGTSTKDLSVGGGDDPYYIQQMFNTFNSNKDILAYEAYFSQVDNKRDLG
jgi:hypothetical protein